MGHIKNLLVDYLPSKQQTPESSDTSSEKNLEPDLLSWVWRAMTDWFGHKWTSHVGPEPLESWAYGLGGLNKIQIKQGINALKNLGHEWPPSLPEFRVMCLVDRSDGAAIAAHMPTYRALPVPPEIVAQRRERAKEAIAECRRILR